MFKLKKRKRKEIYNIAKTATWDVLCSLEFSEQVGEKYPDDMLHKNRMSVWIGNFNGYRDQKMFMKHFGKFIAEFEKERGGGIVCIYNPDTDGLPPNGIM